MMFLFFQTCSVLKGTSVHWLEAQKVAYSSKGDQWVAFDNQQSYDAKVQQLWLKLEIHLSEAITALKSKQEFKENIVAF